jgi:hypothetical protein
MLVFITFFSWLLAFGQPETVNPEPAATTVQNDKHCRIYGSVYLEKDPGRKSFASYTIFVEEEEAFADVSVYQEDNKLFADKTGLWYVTPNRAFADHVLFVTTNRSFADFSVYFTDIRSFAGCRN